MVKKFSSWSFEKQKAPSHRSSPKIFFVNSEEHACEISSYAVKSKIFFVLDWKYTQKCLRAKNGQKILEKPKAPSKKSSPRIFFVDSEAHQSEISCYVVKKWNDL